MRFGAARIACCTIALAASAVAQPAPRSVADAPAFRTAADAWVADALRQLNGPPGCAIAVVVGDEVVLSRGYGKADVEHDVLATDETLFYIASVTKSFTALQATLADARGTLRLDDPLSKHLEGVMLDPALRPADVKLRNLLSHTSGFDNMPIGFRLAYSGEHDPETLWRLIANSTPQEKAPLGVYKYTNAGYNIYALLLDRKTSTRWQDRLRDDLFAPLAMKRTTAYASLPRREKWPIAAPYWALSPTGLRRLDLEKTDATMQSAGGLLSTAHDLGRWLEFQVNEGKLDGKQVIDAKLVRSTHVKLVDASGGDSPFGRDGYGMGWCFGKWRERTVLYHGGNFPGFAALVSFMPDAKLGVAVLANEGTVGSSLPHLVASWAYDWWLNVPDRDSMSGDKLKEAVARRNEAAQQSKAEFEKRSARPWTLGQPKSFYAGRYVNDLYGTIEIAVAGDALTVRQGNLHAVATPFTKPETMRVELLPGRGQVIELESSPAGVQRLQYDGATYERVR